METNDARSMQSRGFDIALNGNDDKWIQIQKKTFQNWVNQELKKSHDSVKDIEYDFENGVKLIILLENLTIDSGQKWRSKIRRKCYVKKPTQRVQMLENVQYAIDIMECENIRLVNIGNDDIVSCNLKLILGMIWKLILKYQISAGQTKPSRVPPKKLMLNFMQQAIPGVKLHNFSHDWNNGIALATSLFRALCNFCDPQLFPDYKTLNPADKLENCKKAIETAERKLGVPALITPEDLSSSALDELSCMTYLSYFVKDNGPGEDAILRWVNSTLGDDNKVTNFSTDWNNGTALCKLNYALNPNSCDLTNLSNEQPRQNCQKGIDSGVVNGVDPLLTAEELSNPTVDPLFVMAYVSKYMNAKPAEDVVVPEDVTSIDLSDFGDSVDGNGGLEASVNSTNHFDVLCSHPSITPNDITVNCDCPQQPPSNAISKKVVGDKCRVAFTPSQSGLHKISVQAKDQHVKGSPMNVNVLPDLTSISVSGAVNKSVSINNEAQIFIKSPEVLKPNDFNVRITSPDHKSQKIPVSLDHGGLCLAKFTPRSTGIYKVAIDCQHRPLPDSPFTCSTYDLDRLKFDGFKDINLGDNLNFKLDVSGCGSGIPQPDVKFMCDNQTSQANLHYSKISSCFSGQFKPTKPGKYQVYIYFQNSLLNGRPIEFDVSMPSSPVLCYGTGLENGHEDFDATFVIDAKKFLPKITEIEVTAEGPNSLAKCMVKSNGDKTYLVTYRPVEVGYFTVTVVINGTPIEACPYKVKVIDARKVKYARDFESFMDKDGHVQLTINQPFSLPFDITAAGDGVLSAAILSPNKKQLPCKFNEAREKGIYILSFTPKELGTYQISIEFDDYPIARSPLTGIATQVQMESVGTIQVSCKGDGLREARVKDEAVFTVDASRAPPGTPQITMSGIHGDIQVKTRKVKENIYECTYTPRVQGKFQCSEFVGAYRALLGVYLLNVAWGDRQVRGSPFKVSAIPSVVSQAVQAFGTGLKEGVLGQPIRFGVDTRSAGPGILSVKCRGPNSEANVDVTDNHDGTFSMNLKPKESGRHVLEIKYDNEHVTGSPFSLRISGPPDATKVHIVGSGIEHGVLNSYKGEFICETKGAGAGQLKVRIHGPKGAFKVEMNRDSQRDRTILVRYNPTEAGDYKIEVWWSDKEIPQSPFDVKIFDTKEELSNFLDKYQDIIKTNNHQTINGDYNWKADV